MCNHKTTQQLLANNQQWADQQRQFNPELFQSMSQGQHPSCLFIGCVDSRVSPNIITQTHPGDLFIHRNIANQIHPDDNSILATLDYAVYTLQVRHIIICGHTHCGGVSGAYHGIDSPTIQPWVQPITNLYQQHKTHIDTTFDNDADRINALITLNIQHGVQTILNTPSLQPAFKFDNAPTVHGWLFELETGLIKEIT